jgi:hypothetical protein
VLQDEATEDESRSKRPMFGAAFLPRSEKTCIYIVLINITYGASEIGMAIAAQSASGDPCSYGKRNDRWLNLATLNEDSDD